MNKTFREEGAITLMIIVYLIVVGTLVALTGTLWASRENLLNVLTEDIRYGERIIQEEEPIKGLGTWYDYDLRTEDQKCRVDDCYSKFNATCASRDFERGSILKVIYKDKSVECRVNDFGPEEWTGKDIDLSTFAFRQLAPLHFGVLEVDIIKIK